MRVSVDVFISNWITVMISRGEPLRPWTPEAHEAFLTRRVKC